MGPSESLVLFDIDGTLIRRAGSHHREALALGIRQVTGHETTLAGVATSGMLDRDLIRLMLANAGVEQPLELQDCARICEVAQSVFEACCPSLGDNLCPGAKAALESLSSQKIPAGLVTGNLSRIAWTKMERAGIRHHFGIGAFAEMADTRTELVAIAIKRSVSHGILHPNGRVALVGDHTNDMEAARRNGVLAIGVATGFTSIEELAAAGADVVLDTLCEFHPGLLHSPSAG